MGHSLCSSHLYGLPCLLSYVPTLCPLCVCYAHSICSSLWCQCIAAPKPTCFIVSSRRKSGGTTATLYVWFVLVSYFSATETGVDIFADRKGRLCFQKHVPFCSRVGGWGGGSLGSVRSLGVCGSYGSFRQNLCGNGTGTGTRNGTDTMPNFAFQFLQGKIFL